MQNTNLQADVLVWRASASRLIVAGTHPVDSNDYTSPLHNGKLSRLKKAPLQAWRLQKWEYFPTGLAWAYEMKTGPDRVATICNTFTMQTWKKRNVLIQMDFFNTGLCTVACQEAKLDTAFRCECICAGSSHGIPGGRQVTAGGLVVVNKGLIQRRSKLVLSGETAPAWA